MPQHSSEFLDPIFPKRQLDDVELVICEKCGCKWMELISVQQYPRNHSVILGQKPPSRGDIGFWMFRCPKCMSLYEPLLNTGGPQDRARKGYDEFLDQILKPIPDSPEGEQV